MMLSIIGIDCATQAKNVGLARGYLQSNTLVIDKLQKPVNTQSVAEIVSSWIVTETHSTYLLAIDAPLGWPVSLGQELVNHTAGSYLNTEANTLFRRETDRFIKQQVAKLPLDVGADRIARTAHAALKLISDVKEQTGRKIELAWNSQLSSGVWAIETYPAATLKVLCIRHQAYKKAEHSAQRKEICTALAKVLRFKAGVDRSLMEQDDDILDAVVCLLTGFHFISNQCMSPIDLFLAKKEGWIWTKKPV